MTVETLSERLFKRHCKGRRVACRRIEEGDKTVADFELTLGCGPVIAEVKQLDPNERDIARESVPPGQLLGSAIAPSNRVRNLLDDAYRQIKPYATMGLPCIVVCYNNAGALAYIDDFTITRAMFGGMAAYLALDSDGIIRHTGQGFTGRRKVTRNTCRGLSAICVLSTPLRGQTKLVVYHNPYATNSLPPESLHALADSQFAYDDPHGSYRAQLLPHQLLV